MLLNEVQRQEKVIGEQNAEIVAQKDEILNLKDRLSRLEAAMASVVSSAKVQ
jgi:hypothetical protein